MRKTCRYFGVARSGFYVWKKAYETNGDEGLVNQKPCPSNPRLRTPPDIVEKVLHLRRTYHLSPIRIVWYLERYHGITISKARVYRILRRHGLNRLPARLDSSTERRLLHYVFSTTRVDSRGFRWTPVDSTAADKRLTSNVLDHKLLVVSQLPKHARTGSTPAASKLACDSAPAAEQARTSEEVQERPARRFGTALLHESSLARTMPPDRILTCRCDTTLVGRGRSSD